MEQINVTSETPQRLKMFYCLSLCNRILGFFLISLVIIWIIQYRGGLLEDNFNWHPLFMIFGMVFVYSKAMLFYRTERTIAMGRLKAMYARLMIVCVSLTIAGIFAGFERNEIAESTLTNRRILSTFTSHSLIASASLILLFCQCVADLFSHIYPGIRLPAWQIYLTLGSFGGAIVACLLGFDEMGGSIRNEDVDSIEYENTFLWFIYSTLITFGGLSVYLLSRDSYKRSERSGDCDSLTKASIFKHLFCIPWSFQECSYSLRMLFSKSSPSSSPPLL